ncbi:hypothetical protein L9F63_021214, partial [Diploptera punctata]
VPIFFKIPIFFTFFPRESGRMLSDILPSSSTGGSRYFSSTSRGSRGKFGGTFSPLLPLEDPDIFQVQPSVVGENLSGKICRRECCRMFYPLLPLEDPDIFQVLPSEVGENLVGRFLLFSHWSTPILFKFFPRERGKYVVQNLFFPRESGKILDPHIFQFSPRESGRILWEVFSSSPTEGSRYFSSSSLGSRGKLDIF